MSNPETYSESSEAVQSHLQIIQSVIERMASNSANCKTWAITLVSAILVIVADKGKPQYALLAIIPTVLFLALDMYYLALEKMFRQAYNSFIEKLHTRRLVPSDLYVVSPQGNAAKTVIAALRSFSIWPFYLTLLAIIAIVKFLVL